MAKVTDSQYQDEIELEEFINKVNLTLRKVNNLSYRMKYTDPEGYKKYRGLFEQLQTKRNEAKMSLKKTRLLNIISEANIFLERKIIK
jgi:hypothetical protein